MTDPIPCVIAGELRLDHRRDPPGSRNLGATFASNPGPACPGRPPEPAARAAAMNMKFDDILTGEAVGSSKENRQRFINGLAINLQQN